MAVDFCVISIGTLSRNRLWGEAAPLRTAHATTTLVTAGTRQVLVDPSLPAPALAARFNERTGRTLADVTDVFCTTLRPVHRRSIAALADAAWWVHGEELAAYRRHLEELKGSAERLDPADAEAVDDDLRLLDRFRAAPEQFDEQVTVYPMAGPSPGSAGLLLTPPTMTVVIAGDAAVTAEHVRRGQVWEGCADTEAAVRTLQDCLELADVLVCGHDNVLVLPGKW